MTKTLPSASRLQELFAYCDETGELRWRKTVGSRALSGALAGSLARQGHLAVTVDGVPYPAHHIAWKLINGADPKGVIRHKNRNRADNRASNLEDTTRSEIGKTIAAVPLTVDTVDSIFEYANGDLLWRTTLGGSARREKAVAGYTNEDGYVVIEVAGKAHLAHRIVWLIHHRSWPSGEIDHKNGVRNDNRIKNLRDVPHLTNTENRRTAVAGSKSGMLGVTIHQSGLFRARILTGGKRHSLGLYDTPEAAHAAYVEAKRKLHKGCQI